MNAKAAKKKNVGKKITINGSFQADSATFTSISGSGPANWYGIVLDNAESASYISNSTIENASYGITCINISSDVILEKNIIQSNSYGILCEDQSSPYIFDNYILNNSIYGIYCRYSSSPYIRHNQLKDNHAGICCINTSSPNLVGKTFFEPNGANEIMNCNTNGFRVYSGSNPNLGTSNLPDHWLAALNNIYNNTSYQVFNRTSNEIKAKLNWWDDFLFYGPIDYNPASPNMNNNAGPTWSLGKTSTFQNDSLVLFEYIEKALLAEGEGKLDKAIENYRYIIDNFPESGYATFSLSRLMACRSKQRNIPIEYEYLMELENKYGMNPLGQLATMWIPLVYAKQGLRSDVESKCVEVKTNYSHTDLARDILSELILVYLYDFNDYDAAKQSFEQFKFEYINDPLVNELESILNDWKQRGLFKKPQSPASSKDIPLHFALYQNFPNPFNPVTKIRYQLAEDCHVTIKIFNILGQEIRTLVNENKKAGTHEIFWDGLNDIGNAVTSGVYFYKIEASNFMKIKKTVLMR